ncbi:hypothetical protein [Agrobacterium sp. T29]|uniref:hypothetical protein n=1 Tax=Agrobacterium sp. T29 TaxID=2580515 RepID=UPI00115E4DC1|nr:hypothetical protein [Agrobacterium sp. T29]
MDLDPDVIERIWFALQRPAPPSRPRAEAMIANIAATGWASEVEIGDLLLTLDRRTDPPAVIDIKAFVAALELPFRWAFLRPRHRNDDPSGVRMLSIVDLAALCVWLERLGFQIDVTDLCAEAVKHTTFASHVSGEDIYVLFYEANRHRLGSVTLSARIGNGAG